MTINNVKDLLLTKIADAIKDDCLEKAERYTALFDRLVMSEVQSRMTDAHINGELMSEELE